MLKSLNRVIGSGTLAAVLILSFTMSLLVLVGCSSVMQAVLDEPKVTFGSIAVRDAGNDGATVVVGLNVENPNRVGLQIDELNYVLEMGGRQVAASKLEKIAQIEPKATTKVEIPIPFRYDQVFSSVLDLISKGTAAYKIKGEAQIGLFKLPFDQSGELKL